MPTEGANGESKKKGKKGLGGTNGFEVGFLFTEADSTL